jgi:hypothetical protein
MFESDLRADTAAFDTPTLVVHGNAEQVAPIGITGEATAAAIPGSKLVIYPGGLHAVVMTDHERFNRDLLEMIGVDARHPEVPDRCRGGDPAAAGGPSNTGEVQPADETKQPRLEWPDARPVRLQPSGSTAFSRSK